MDNKDKAMLPLSREEVEVDGIYTNEWGREEQLRRGEDFPSDPMMGTTEWQLSEFTDEQFDGHTNDPGVPGKDNSDKQGKVKGPRRHLKRGDR